MQLYEGKHIVAILNKPKQFLSPFVKQLLKQ